MTARHLKCDVAVVGAGPAGLAAATAAASTGAKVVCIDQFAGPGGQYFMQPVTPDTPLGHSAQVRAGAGAIRVCREAGVTLLTEAELFWAEATSTGFRANLCVKGAEALVIDAATLVVASGAMERPLPFPGWTLPGVISAGAAQRLLKSAAPGGGLPFRGKTVLAGTGPFLLAVAATFHKSGHPLDHFIEMRRPALGDVASLLARNPGRIGESIGLVRDLLCAGARRHFGTMVIRAIGTDQIEAIEVAPLDAQGNPILAKAQIIDGVGALCVGFGFQPVIDLTTALGASHRHDPALGGWYCVADAETGATSVRGVFAAGEVAGIGGARPAQLSGQLAGMHAAARATRATLDGNHCAGLRRDLTTARAFAASLAALFPPPPTLPLELPEDEIVCRCEDVRIRDISAAVADGARDTLGVKMWTRAGMGPCQGRICGGAIAAALRAAGVPTDQAAFNRSHMPLRPVSVSVVQAALSVPPQSERNAP